MEQKVKRTKTPEQALVSLMNLCAKSERCTGDARRLMRGRGVAAADGEKVLRAKIDMAHPNINMRDPAMYRILHIKHHRQGNKWCIYPMYDFAHPLQDSFEGITHSLCSLEYDNHRILYDWFIENCEMEHVSHQYEFGRLNITNTIMSKRYLRALVDSRKVDGYDDPRMPTLCGLRRRGFTADSIRNFILATGLSRVNSTV